MNKTKIIPAMLAAIMTLSIPISSYAGAWKYEEPYWMNIEKDGTRNIGWYSEGKNDWYYLDGNGTMQTGWHEDYHLHEVSDGMKGRMDYGWYYDGTYWYFLNTVHNGRFGAKMTGWQWIDGYCYLFAQDGKMYVDTQTPDGYLVNKDGRWVKDGVIQFIPGKGLSSRPNEPDSYPSWSGNSGGKVISGGSSSKGGYPNGSPSKPVSPDEKDPEKPNDEEKESITLIENKDLLKLLSDAENASSEEEKTNLVSQADSLFVKALKSEQIENYKWNESKTAVSCEYPNGMIDIFGFWEPEYDEFFDTVELEIGTVSDAIEKTYQQAAEDEIEMFSIPLSTLSEKNDESAAEIKNKEVIILSGFPENGTYDDEVYLRGPRSIKEKLDSFPDEKFTCRLEYKATIDDYKTLGRYGIIFINCHGQIDTRGLLYNDEDISVLCLGESVTTAKDKKYLNDLRSQRVLRYISNNKSTYVITPNFIQYYFGSNKLDGSAVYCDACLGYYTDSLANAFLDSGAELFIGYNESVRALYGGAIAENMTEHLLEGLSFDEALDVATGELCANDNDYVETILKCTLTDNKAPASPKLGGNGNVIIVNRKNNSDVSSGIAVNYEKLIGLILNWFKDNEYVIESTSKDVQPGGYSQASIYVHKNDEEKTLGSSSFILFVLNDETGELVDTIVGLKNKEDNFKLAQKIGEFVGISFSYDEYNNAPIDDLGFACVKTIEKSDLMVEFVFHANEKDDYISIKPKHE